MADSVEADCSDVRFGECEDMQVRHNGQQEVDETEVTEYLLDNVPQRVLPGLFIGSAWAEMNEPALTKAGITDILQVAQGLFPRHPMLFTYMVLQVEDAPTTDLVRHFPTCFEFIDKALAQGGSVLVHCAAGVSRSATVVLGYLMCRHHYSLARALEHLKAVRPWVAPNLGFLQQLEAYEAAKCDLSDWRPWCLVWYERQQQQQQQQGQDAALQQPAAPAPQQQQWLQLPQPRDSSAKQQQQQQQGRQQPSTNGIGLQPQQGCSSTPALQQQVVGGSGCQPAVAGNGSNAVWRDGSISSAASSLSHASLAVNSAASGIGSSAGSNGGCGAQNGSSVGLQPSN